MDERIFLIPKPLTEEYGFLACYSVADAGVITLLFSGAVCVAFATGWKFVLGIPVLYSILRFKVDGYTMYHWARRALSFLLNDLTHQNTYTLLEEEEITWN